MKESDQPIAALEPNGNGYQFVCYADSCSGIENGPNEQNFAKINKIVSRLMPPPEFICFPGDEIRGLLADQEQLWKQWRYWLDVEMGWLDRSAVPIYHTTGNHTAYDPASIEVFRKALPHLPKNGPAGQEGLSYFVRKQDLLLIFVNTLNEDLGGEGWVETDWLEQTLKEHADAKHKIVLGHHPIHPVNGFSGPHQRTVEPESGGRFWEILARHCVIAYVCSHILAFDVQVHQGVLQILTGGAGTMPLSPESAEYFHCVQMAVDGDGLRYQVLDTNGKIRDWLKWPIHLPPSGGWEPFKGAFQKKNSLKASSGANLIAFHISGTCSAERGGNPQTLLCAKGEDSALSPIWIGLRGVENRLCVLIVPEVGRSPRFWLGPKLPKGEPFAFQLGLHSGMGPGGILWRWDDSSPWSSLKGTTAWGVEKIDWPVRWVIGRDQFDKNNRPFQGDNLEVKSHAQTLTL